MVIRNDVSQSGGGSTATGSTRGESHIGPGGSWRASAPQGPTLEQLRRRRLLVLLSVILLIAIILAGVRLAAGASGTNDQLFIRIGNQQVVTLDLRQSLPINPAILGVNVFPEIGTISRDNANGFMQYSSSMAAGFRYAQIKIMR